METSRAFVVHMTPRRIRIKIPRWERQDAYFAALQQLLQRRPGVVSVRANALAASIVIHCRDGFEIASVGDCFGGLELVVPGSAGGSRMGQIASAQRRRDRSTYSIFLVGLVVRLVIAIATRRFEVVVRELILEAALQAVVPQLYRKPMRPLLPEAPQALLLAAAR